MFIKISDNYREKTTKNEEKKSVLRRMNEIIVVTSRTHDKLSQTTNSAKITLKIHNKIRILNNRNLVFLLHVQEILLLFYHRTNNP
jgi:hypothetical protein